MSQAQDIVRMFNFLNKVYNLNHLIRKYTHPLKIGETTNASLITWKQYLNIFSQYTILWILHVTIINPYISINQSRVHESYLSVLSGVEQYYQLN